MIILVPSYKRPGNVATRAIFPDSVLCVHEFEAEQYKEMSGGSIAVIPDDLRGNMAKVRNWMLRYGFEQDDEVIMCDDDIKSFDTMFDCTTTRMSEEYVREMLQNGFRMARELGTRLWGINVQNDPRFYNTWKPIGLTLPVLGTFCGHIKHSIYYDERLSLNEDYDFFLQVLRKYRKVLRLDMFAYQADHLKKKGGCGAYRTMAEERAQAEIMIKKWGDKIVRYDKKGKDPNPILRSPI